ncbi:MAG: hypothetical protein GY841_00300 [FCB group bacterium]|nr:hypothetical protein [FCB group bacterium]
MQSSGKVDLLGLGIAPVDFFVSMNGYPEPGQKIDSIGNSHLIRGGGPVPTALCTFSKLGGNSSLVTTLGDDMWGRFVRTELDRFGVEHKHCIERKNCRHALAFAWIDISTGDRTIVLDTNKKMTVKPADIKTDSLPIPKLIHLDGRHLPACLKLARWGKKVGAKIMLDVGSVRNRVDDLFPYIDYLVCADQFASDYTGRKSLRPAVKSLKDNGIPEVVVTSGVKGSFGIDAEGNEARQRAYRVKAVDVTGAGDVFHGSYLFGIFKDWPLEDKLKFAAAAAALKCRLPGARDGIPSYRQAKSFMKKHRSFYA